MRTLHVRYAAPLQSHAYRTRPELSATYVQWLDRFLADPAHQYDPIVQAQERPTHYELGPAVVSGGEGDVPITFEWADMISHDYVVFRPKDGVWQISNIAMVSQEPKATPTSAPAPAVPADQVVQGFYTWYLHYQGNPLVDHAYRSRSELSPAFMAWVDRFLNQSCDCGDPVLQTQNTPMSFQVGQPSVSGTVATVVVTFAWGQVASGQETWDINLKLMQAAGRWQIAGITRGGASTHIQ